MKKRNVKESAFTLVEIVIALVVLGILAAIAIPVFSHIKNELDSTQLKSEMTQAAILIETEALDNNGLYPTYIPNEVIKLTQNIPDSSGYHLKSPIYTYNNSRTNWCMQVDSPLGKLFISNVNKSPSGDVCTQDNIGSNSSTPWQVPNVPLPSVTAFNTTWASDSSNAIAVVKFSEVTCDLSAADQAEWGDSFHSEYSVQLTNNSRPSPVINATAWGTNTTVTVALPGWLPEDSITAKVRARCVTDYATGYSYTGSYGPSSNTTVAWFEVDDVNWGTAPNVSWPAANPNPAYNASWSASAFCPSGTVGYALGVTGTLTTGTGTLMQRGTPTSPVIWASGYSGALSANTLGGSAVTSKMQVVCSLSDGRKRASAGITHTITDIPMKAPTAVPTIARSDAAGETTVFPNRITWTGNGAVCQVGTLQYLITRTSPSAVTILNWGTSTQIDQTFSAGTSYTYTVQTRCANAGKTSAVRGTGSVTFTATWNIPPTPSKVTGIGHNSAGTATYTDNRLTWNHVSCPNSTPTYLVRQVMKNGTTIADASRPGSGWSLTTNYYNIPEGMLPAGSTVEFEINAKCAGPGGDSDTSGYAGGAAAKWTTNIPSPSAPLSLSHNSYSTVTWSNPTTTCAAGTTLQFYSAQTQYGGSATFSLIRDWTASYNSGVTPQFAYGWPLKVEVTARCVGPNATSANSLTSSLFWYSALPAPYNYDQMHYASSPSWCPGCGSNNARYYAICTSGASPTSLYLQVGKQGAYTYGPWNVSNAQAIGGTDNMSSRGWGSSWFVRAKGLCQTPWVVSPWGYSYEGTGWGSGTW